jgi:hypothetical protein
VLLSFPSGPTALAYVTDNSENLYTKKVNVMVKLTPEQATYAQRGSRCTALLFL